MEYRKAFMTYVRTGVMGAELRDDRQDVGKELFGNLDIHAVLPPYAKTKISRIAMSRP